MSHDRDICLQRFRSLNERIATLEACVSVAVMVTLLASLWSLWRYFEGAL